MSYFPTFLYRYGYDDIAYDYLMQLPKNPRCAYPEVSYGWMEALVEGYLGLNPEASTHSVSTLLRSLGEDNAEVRNVPVWNGYLTLRHDGHCQSTLFNQTGVSFDWLAKFYGHFDKALVDGKECPVEYATDKLGKEFSVVKVHLPNGTKSIIKVF